MQGCRYTHSTHSSTGMHVHDGGRTRPHHACRDLSGELATGRHEGDGHASCAAGRASQLQLLHLRWRWRRRRGGGRGGHSGGDRQGGGHRSDRHLFAPQSEVIRAIRCDGSPHLMRGYRRSTRCCCHRRGLRLGCFPQRTTPDRGFGVVVAHESHRNTSVLVARICKRAGPRLKHEGGRLCGVTETAQWPLMHHSSGLAGQAVTALFSTETVTRRVSSSHSTMACRIGSSPFCRAAAPSFTTSKYTSHFPVAMPRSSSTTYLPARASWYSLASDGWQENSHARASVRGGSIAGTCNTPPRRAGHFLLFELDEVALEHDLGV